MPKALPGYAGTVPSASIAPLPIKTAINERPVPRQRSPQRQAAGASVAAVALPSIGACLDGSSMQLFRAKRTTVPTTYGDMAQLTNCVTRGSQVPPRMKPVQVSCAESTKGCHVGGTSVAHTMSDAFVTPVLPGGAPVEKETFFSHVRKLEQQDDDVRFSENHITTRSSAAHHVRNVAIRSRRENDSSFVPPAPAVVENTVRRAKPTAWTGATDGSSPVCVVTPPSSYHQDFVAPQAKSAIAAATLQQSSRLPLSLSTDRALIEASSTRDLFDATAKNRPDIASGFMGHVPSSANQDRVRGADHDMLRAHSKCYVNVVAGGTTSGHRMAEAASSPERRAQTVGGFQLEQAATCAPAERAMNRVEHGRQNAVRGFFSAGVGQADPVIADQFCVRYRPLEGLMKHGPASTHGWISDKELRSRRL